MLLDALLNVGWLGIQVNSVFVLEIFYIVVQKCLIISQLLANRLKTDLVDCCFGTHGFKREQKLFADVYDLSGERCPLGLRLYQGALGVLLFLLQNQVMFLQKNEFLLQFFGF